jgi:hypothetical protein
MKMLAFMIGYTLNTRLGFTASLRVNTGVHRCGAAEAGGATEGGSILARTGQGAARRP